MSKPPSGLVGIQRKKNWLGKNLKIRTTLGADPPPPRHTETIQPSKGYLYRGPRGYCKGGAFLVVFFVAVLARGRSRYSK